MVLIVSFSTRPLETLRVGFESSSWSRRRWKQGVVNKHVRGQDMIRGGESITRLGAPPYDDGSEDAYILANRCFYIPFNDVVLLTLRQRVNSSSTNFGTEPKPKSCSRSLPQRRPPHVHLQSPGSHKSS